MGVKIRGSCDYKSETFDLCVIGTRHAGLFPPARPAAESWAPDYRGYVHRLTHTLRICRVFILLWRSDLSWNILRIILIHLRELMMSYYSIKGTSALHVPVGVSALIWPTFKQVGENGNDSHRSRPTLSIYRAVTMINKRHRASWKAVPASVFSFAPWAFHRCGSVHTRSEVSHRLQCELSSNCWKRFQHKAIRTYVAPYAESQRRLCCSWWISVNESRTTTFILGLFPLRKQGVCNELHCVWWQRRNSSICLVSETFPVLRRHHSLV